MSAVRQDLAISPLVSTESADKRHLPLPVCQREWNLEQHVSILKNKSCISVRCSFRNKKEKVLVSASLLFNSMFMSLYMLFQAHKEQVDLSHCLNTIISCLLLSLFQFHALILHKNSRISPFLWVMLSRWFDFWFVWICRLKFILNGFSE